MELADVLDKLGLKPSSLYHHGAADLEVPQDNSACEELRPYRPLDAEWIRLVGSGDWDCTPFLSDLLDMPFAEPEVIRLDIIPPKASFPDVRECDVHQTFELCKVWDARGPLKLIQTSLGPTPDELFLHSKVFGNYKSPEAYDSFVDDFGEKKRQSREKAGDFLGMPKPLLVDAVDSLPVFAASGSIFQGDHLGVEISLCPCYDVSGGRGSSCFEQTLCRSEHIAQQARDWPCH